MAPPGQWMRYRAGMFSRSKPWQATAKISPTCLNCGEDFAGRGPRFCPACGQETTLEPPTLREFAQQFGGAYFSTEGALWRTLKLLLTRPGELTVQYLAGRRKLYVLPLRLYLTISLLALIVVRLAAQVDLVGGLDGPEVVAAEAQAFPSFVLNLRGLRFGVKDGVFICDNLPAAVCKVLHARAASDARSFLHKVRQSNERVLANFGAVMFVLLPLFALCLRVVNRHAGMGYAAHLVFALHLHSFWFLVLALMQLNWAPVTWAGGAAMVLYTLVAGRRVYGGLWWQRVLRALLLSVLYATLLALTVPVAWLLALLL